MSSFVYIVGRADPNNKSVAAARALGYNVGLFHDRGATLKNPEQFDHIVELDFSKLDSELEALDTTTLDVAGLLCTYENYVIAKAKLAQQLHVPALTLQSALLSTDKYRMRQAFIDYNPDITPRFAHVSNAVELLDFAASTTYPIMLKPANLVKSLLVLRCNTKQELLDNFRYASSAIVDLYKAHRIYDRAPQLIAEEFIHGKSCSIAAFVDHTGTPHFCEGITALTTASEHGANDNYLYRRHVPLQEKSSTTARLFDVAKQGITALAMRSTPAHVELIYSGDDVKIVEIGARTGGYRPTMYQHSYGIDLPAQEIQLAVGNKPELAGALQTHCAVYELFPSAEGTFVGISGLRDPSVYTRYSVKGAIGSLVGPAKNGYKATAVVMVTHHNKATFDTLCASVDKLQVEIA